MNTTVRKIRNALPSTRPNPLSRSATSCTAAPGSKWLMYPPVGTSMPFARSQSRRGRTSALMRARYSGMSPENSRMDVPTSTVTPIPAAIMAPMTTSMASHLGSPLRSSQNRGGALMMAMNTESRKGTTIASAARIPATITTNAAAVSSTDPALDLPVTSFISAPQALRPRSAVYPASPGRSRRPARGPAALRLCRRRRGGVERARVRPRRRRLPADPGHRAPMPCGRVSAVPHPRGAGSGAGRICHPRRR